VIEFTNDAPSFAEGRLRNPGEIKGAVSRVGDLRHGDLTLYVPSHVLEDMRIHSETDLGMELGGVLVGDIYSWKGSPYVEVAGYIPAEEYEHTAASFRFTHDSWEQIHRDLNSRFPGKLILGWHHTHPGYGVFLSGADRFIQENFFNLPYHFAAVTDPRAERMGFFQNKEGKIELIGGYFEVSPVS
jgi:proteasome lid subunit RPN8/RPN11